MLEFVGIVGMVLILAGWIPQTWASLKSGKSIDARFAVLYALGSLFLSAHAFIIGDSVFLILNSIAFIIAIINIYLAHKKRG